MAHFKTGAILLLLAALVWPALGQLPDDIQQELERGIAEQARLEALRRQQQQQQQAQQPAGTGSGRQAAPTSRHDPNNYSYQQVSPPVQYSYYQPFGDAGNNQQQPQQQQQQANQPLNLDLNNFNLDLPARQPAASQRHSTPSFTGAGGLPVLQPVVAAEPLPVPAGQAPLAPQARVQQGPPLTEADFRDITGGENYGAPGGNDFGLGSPPAADQAASSPRDSTDDQLAEFGMPGNRKQQQATSRRMDPQQMSIPDFGGFGPIGMGGGGGNAARSGQRQDPAGGFGNFADLGSFGGSGGQSQGQNRNSQPAGEFDFASQPSSRQPADDTPASAGATSGNVAPGSLQSLLGAGFPGLGDGSGGSGLEGFASGANDPQRARQDDNAMEVGNLADKSDQFSGADLGGFEQPGPQNDQDFNFNAAAATNQPKSVAYPDGGPQPVGTLLTLGQPQMLTQTRYNALPDKGTYQDYPAYVSGGNDFGAVAGVVDGTPRARSSAPGRYGHPSQFALAPEVREALGGRPFDYALSPEQQLSSSDTGSGSDQVDQ